MLATEPASLRCLQLPAYSHEGFYYVRQRADGVVLVGGARHLHMLEERGYADQTTPALQADLEKFLHQHFPQKIGRASCREREYISCLADSVIKEISKKHACSA